MQRVTTKQALRLSQLEQELGNRTLRQLLTQENQRLVRPDRLSNLVAGSGKLSASELDRIEAVSRNARLLKALKNRGSGKREFKTNRAMRDWLVHGRAKGGHADQPEEDRWKAIKALGFLGVDPSSGTFYINQRKA